MNGDVFELVGSLSLPEQLVLQAGAGALLEEGERIMADSREHYVPVDLAILKGSGHVRLPEVDGGEVSVVLAYGGPAEAYAIVQHENLDYHHTVGEAKYLEKPLMAAQAGMLERVGAAVRVRLGL